MSYTDKFEAFSIIKNGTTYKVIPFSETKYQQINTCQDKKSKNKTTNKKTKKNKIEKKEYNCNVNKKHKTHGKKKVKNTITLFFFKN